MLVYSVDMDTAELPHPLSSPQSAEDSALQSHLLELLAVGITTLSSGERITTYDPELLRRSVRETISFSSGLKK